MQKKEIPLQNYIYRGFKSMSHIYRPRFKCEIYSQRSQQVTTGNSTGNINDIVNNSTGSNCLRN